MAEKKIVSRQHLEAFLASRTHSDVVEFVEELNESVVGVTLRSKECHQSEVSLAGQPASTTGERYGG